ncbi:MAG: IS200/IS605 family transposase [Candidatus Kapabacteria bacterium]|nr:IS200/IS605 family transposase [Candidatus Kapabacteria bacterium]
MAGTYTQIYIQIVIVVKGRDNLIRNENKDELYKYISGIVHNKGHKMLCINGVANHIHFLIGFKPVEQLSELVKEIKRCSSLFINERKWVKGKFEWQSGYGAFSYSHSQISKVALYIENQEEHHRRKTFKEEYIELLNKFNVAYDERYIFEDVGLL